MIRDMDLVRSILRTIELDPNMNNTADYYHGVDYFEVDPSRAPELEYVLTLLIDQGFINGRADSGYAMPIIRGLTWNGHELIADIADPDTWQKTKDRLKVVGGAGIAFAWEIAKGEVRKKLGLPQ